jgi:hypothetical protein
MFHYLLRLVVGAKITNVTTVQVLVKLPSHVLSFIFTDRDVWRHLLVALCILLLGQWREVDSCSVMCFMLLVKIIQPNYDNKIKVLRHGHKAWSNKTHTHTPLQSWCLTNKQIRKTVWNALLTLFTIFNNRKIWSAALCDARPVYSNHGF